MVRFGLVQKGFSEDEAGFVVYFYFFSFFSPGTRPSLFRSYSYSRTSLVGRAGYIILSSVSFCLEKLKFEVRVATRRN